MKTTFRQKLEDTDSPEHKAMLKHVKGYIDASRKEMSKNYEKWDCHQRNFESVRTPDKEDRNSERRGNPKKLIVPLTFSEIMTFVAFCIMSITQNRRFFELEPTGPEDNVLMEPMELILERDVRRNTWNSFLIQFFLDIGRFSLAAAEVCYQEEYRYMRVPQEQEVEGAFGAMTKESSNAFQSIPTFIGNRVYPISPYRFFPDVSLPITRYQEGEYCGSEDVFGLARLRGMGDDVFNLDKIPKYTEDDYKARLKSSRVDIGPADGTKNANLYGYGADGEKDSSTMMKTGAVVVTKVVFDQIPADFEKDSKTVMPLGAETFPVRYMCWIANDKTIIRFEEAYCVHGMFPYICGQYIPDQHNVVNQGLADICDQIANLVTWKLNAHIASQKNSVESKWIVDPAGIDTKSLESRTPYIYLKKNASQTGIDRYIKQFTTVDVTAGVLQDISGLKDLLESATGISAQMQGQYSQGRRSATQDRVVAQGAGARGKTTLSGIWDTGFEPLGKQLIANNRQEMDLETFSRIMGARQWPVNPAAPPTADPTTGMPVPVRFTTEEIFVMFKADPVTIATSEDFFVFDGTLPSEKAFLAQSLQEILMQIMQNPEVAGVLGFGPEQVKELFDQIYLLRGVTPARLPMPTGTVMPPPPEQTGGGSAPKQPVDHISYRLPDFAGDERKQALSLLGIKEDRPAADKMFKALHPPPNSGKSNGS